MLQVPPVSNHAACVPLTWGTVERGVVASSALNNAQKVLSQDCYCLCNLLGLSVHPSITFQREMPGSPHGGARVSVRSDRHWVISHSCLGRHQNYGTCLANNIHLLSNLVMHLAYIPQRGVRKNIHWKSYQWRTPAIVGVWRLWQYSCAVGDTCCAVYKSQLRAAAAVPRLLVTATAGRRNI